MCQMLVVGVHSIGEAITVEHQAIFQIRTIDLTLITRLEVDRQKILAF